MFRNKFDSLISIFDRNTIVHLRLPFSIYLLPIFCFGLSQTPVINLHDTVILFAILHFFIYPASNIYNSYMDKDEGSIGALEKPPPVTKKLYYASIVFDLCGLTLCLLIHIKLLLLCMVYISVSKAYSWHRIRIKKYPFLSWLIVSLFQGGFTFYLVNAVAITNFSIDWFTNKNIFSFIIATFLVGAIYPLTQIYQHKEDNNRGDKTISLILGINGTFIFSALFFIQSIILMWFYFSLYYSLSHFFFILSFIIPVMIYFLHWFYISLKDITKANFKHAMMLNKISAPCMITGFLILFYLNH